MDPYHSWTIVNGDFQVAKKYSINAKLNEESFSFYKSLPKFNRYIQTVKQILYFIFIFKKS